MGGYLGTKAVLLSTTAANVTGNADITGNLTVGGNLTITGTVDGVDIAARDAVLTSTTTTANSALPKAGGTMTGALTVQGAFTSQGIDDNANAIAITIDSSENVSIGHASPTAALDVRRGDASGRIAEFHTNTGFGIELGSSQSEAYVQAGSNQALLFNTNGSNERLRIDSSGHVLINNTAYSANGTLVVQQTADSKGVAIIDSGAANTFFLENDGTINKIRNNSTVPIAFETNSAERMRLDSSGNLLVGKTTVGVSSVGAELRGGVSDYAATAVSSSHPAALFGRNTDDGDIIKLRKDNSDVGGIGVQSSDLVIYSSASGHEGLRFGNGAIVPTNNTGVSTDNACNLGCAGGRFTDVYLAGGVFLGGTGLANKLHDYEEGSWTPVIGGNSSTSGQSYSIQHGTYTKIGNAVHLHAYVAFTTTGTMSGSYATIQGLPFSVANNNGSYAAVNVGYYSGLGISVTSIQGYTNKNTHFAYLTHSPAAQAAISYLTPSQLGTGPALILSITYNTNS